MEIQAEKIQAIFFDIGGVLLTNGWGHESRQKAAAHFGIDYAEMDALHDFVFPVYEMGKVTLDDYLERVVFTRQRSFNLDEFKTFMLAESIELPGTLAWLKDWKKKIAGRYRVISLNNEGRELNQHRIKTFQLNQLFDAYVCSCELGMLKPDPELYKLALGIAQCRPDECLYFDDRKILVEAAKKQGMGGIQHTGLEGTRKILEALL